MKHFSNLGDLKDIFFYTAFFLILLSGVDSSFAQSGFKNQLLEENFKFFLSGVDKDTALPYDHIFVNEDKTFKFGKYCSPTIVGFWAVLLTDIVQGDVKFNTLGREKALQLLLKLLNSLENLPRWRGLFYWYNLEKGVHIAENEMVSTYDNANLTLSLMVVYAALSDSSDSKERDIARRIYKILSLQKKTWRRLYDSRKGLLYAAFRKGRPLDIWVDRFYTEGRAAALVSILLGGVSDKVWFNLLRPENSPRGEYTLSNGRRVKFLKPYQGAFQAWLPLLFIPELKLSPLGLKKVHQNYALIQIDYVLHSKIPLLRSAAANPDIQNKYVYEPSIGIFNASEDWVRSDIGTPYATALLYMIYPEKSLTFFRKAENEFPHILGPLGFYDAVSEKGQIAKVYLALDQLQLLLAFLAEINQDYFMKYVEYSGKAESLRKLYKSVKF